MAHAKLCGKSNVEDPAETCVTTTMTVVGGGMWSRVRKNSATQGLLDIFRHFLMMIHFARKMKHDIVALSFSSTWEKLRDLLLCCTTNCMIQYKLLDLLDLQLLTYNAWMIKLYCSCRGDQNEGCESALENITHYRYVVCVLKWFFCFNFVTQNRKVTCFWRSGLKSALDLGFCWLSSTISYLRL